jgi:RNA polymerase sigma factor (sigma-70 family)
MNAQADQQLLREYAENRSESAFAELVRRHLDLVYSAAVRMVRDPHQAEDVAQNVFVSLAQNAGRLAGHPVLSGWLHRTTHNLAANAIRTSVRRQAREQEAAAMNELLASSADDSWKLIAPHLDAVLEELNEPDRDAVLLRYFEKKSAQEMALVLNVSADAAQKRVNRAVERLREIFSARGVSLGASGLIVVISTHAMQAAPAGLATAISAQTLAGATLSTVAAATAKTIAMTTLQKTLVATTIVALAGAGLYQTHRVSQLRDQVRTLRQQVGELSKPAPVPQTDAPSVQNAPTPAVAAQPQNVESDWAARLQALDKASWREAFALGQQLATLPPDTGLAILRANWNNISNFEARQQLLKAFSMAEHERLPAVLELGLLDSNAEVQNWAIDYLKEVALQDFTTDFNGAKNWLAAKRDSTLGEAFADAATQAAGVLRNADANQLVAELSLIGRATQLFSKFPESIRQSGLDQMLAAIAAGNDSKAANLALEAAAKMQLGEDWYRTVALPRLSDPNLSAAAARAIASTKSDWALAPLLNALCRNAYASHSDTRVLDHATYWDLAGSIGDLGSPKAIPTMIALIEEDDSRNNAQQSRYGIGYFGLRRLTGVNYDDKHDGAWWRQWWANNKQRYPADVQALEIPQLDPATLMPVSAQPPK